MRILCTERVREDVQFCSRCDERGTAGIVRRIALYLAVLFMAQDAVGEFFQRQQRIIGIWSPITQLESIIRRHRLAVLKQPQHVLRQLRSGGRHSVSDDFTRF
jgi:hypothetical protein